MTRRTALECMAAGALAAAPNRTPVINGAEHAWVTRDPRFPIDPQLAVCPNNLPNHD